MALDDNVLENQCPFLRRQTQINVWCAEGHVSCFGKEISACSANVFLILLHLQIFFFFLKQFPIFKRSTLKHCIMGGEISLSHTLIPLYHLQ